MRVKIRAPFSVMMLAASVSVQAGEYSVTPFASARTEVDTNRRLVQDSDTNFGVTASAGALFRASSDESSLSITPSVSLKQFTDDGTDIDQDTEDYFLDMRADHRINDKFSVGAYFSYDNVGVVDSELEDLGITFGGNDIASTGFELPNENFSVETISAGPSITYVISEKNSLIFGGSYTQAEYENQDTQLSDYTNYSIDASWVRQLSLTDQFIVSIFTSKNDPDLNSLERGSVNAGRAFANDGITNVNTLNDEFDETGINLGYVRAFSDTLTANFTIGVRKTKGEFPDLTDFDIRLSQVSAATLQGQRGGALTTTINRLDPILSDIAFLNANPGFLTNSSQANHTYKQGSVDSTGLLLDLSVEKKYNDRTLLTAGLTKATYPTGRGLVDREEVSFGANHSFTDRIIGKSKLRYFRTDTVSEETLDLSNQASDQIRLEAGVDWRMTEFWTLGGGYSYRSRSPEQGESADSHGLFLTVGYNGNKYAVSR